MSLDFTKPLELIEDGAPFRFYAKDGAQPHPIHGAILIDGAWFLTCLEESRLRNVPPIFPQLDQPFVLTVKDLYGTEPLVAPTGFRFKIENKKCAFRFVEPYEWFLGILRKATFNETHPMKSSPRLILEEIF